LLTATQINRPKSLGAATGAAGLEGEAMTETTQTKMEVAYAGYLDAVEAVTKIIEANKEKATDPEDANPGLWDAVEDAARHVADAPVTNERDALLACACVAAQVGELDLISGEEDQQTAILLRRVLAEMNIPMPSYLTKENNKGNA
jgi:hypothetical protein